MTNRIGQVNETEQIEVKGAYSASRTPRQQEKYRRIPFQGCLETPVQPLQPAEVLYAHSCWQHL